MAPEHQQREHGGGRGKERERERERWWWRGLKSRHKSQRKYVEVRQRQRHISGRNVMIISLSPLPAFILFLDLFASLILNLAQKCRQPSKTARVKSKKGNKEMRRISGENKEEKSADDSPDLVAFILVADWQQVQQDLIEVA